MRYLDLYNGNCLEVMKDAPDNSIDAVVTDPPYGLAFMNKKWDYDVPSVEIWKEVLRVLKPGGHLLAFGGTRTYHRLAVNIEDAGFEIRDQIQWLYGQGFPKSLDVSKAIDKAAGASREIVGPSRRHGGGREFACGASGFNTKIGNVTAPSTAAAKQWEGWGTALKPANEPIVLARKPLEKGLTVAQNVQKWGTGAINIDGCRISLREGEENLTAKRHELFQNGGRTEYDSPNAGYKTAGRGTQVNLDSVAKGRFPANVILDEEAGAALDAQTQLEVSRFFYCAKASTSERNAGLEELPAKSAAEMVERADGSAGMNSPRAGAGRTSGGKNVHPTVKPVKLMEYLCRLITPPGGIVLDPFMGSGTTGIAAGNEGFGFVGIEMNPEYFEIAKRRIGAQDNEAA